MSNLFQLESVTWLKNDESSYDTSYPTFLVKGSVAGRTFESKIGLSLEDQEAETTHVSGYDLNNGWEEIPGFDTAELFILVNKSDAYLEANQAHMNNEELFEKEDDGDYPFGKEDDSLFEDEDDEDDYPFGEEEEY